MAASKHACAVLSVDLDAVAANYDILKKKAGGAQCAAVVKADAYGLGLAPVATRLAREGCRHFFVAQFPEAISLRETLDDVGQDGAIYVLNGPDKGAEREFENARAIPILNSLQQIHSWSSHAIERAAPQEAVLHIDTGMTRLGLTENEVKELATDRARLDGLNIRFVMSHLACAEENKNPLNHQQRNTFESLRSLLPTAPASLANSSGIFLGDKFHYDLVRPGSANYGISPVLNESNPMRQVINLKGEILQVRVVDTNMTVGYGATYRVTRPGRIATVAVGYGDGYPRQLSNRGHGYLGGTLVPMVGRVSMDLTTFDVTDVPESDCQPGMMIDLINDRHTVDDVAREAETIGYEILTNLGNRYQRRYLGKSDK
jgi:alanine racemase